jgi:putative hydrolase of the HAD superfamily
LISDQIKNLVFDLGGVILNLDTGKTFEAFASLSGKPVAELKVAAGQTSFFNDYEKGLLSDSQFREELKSFLGQSLSDQQIDQAWNAMLLDLPQKKLALLQELRKTHRLFLLSNTNNIHLQCFNQIVKETTGLPMMDSFFERAYYSHLLKMRKPDAEIFLHVLHENNLHADQTLFMDDNLDNVEGAGKVGIRTAHIAHPDDLIHLFA